MLALLLVLALDWNPDLSTLATEIPKTHPNAFHRTTRDAFLGEIERLRTRAPKMQPHEVVVEIARIVAMIGDGHTRLTLPLDVGYGFQQGHTPTPAPKDPALAFHAIPLRFAIVSDGLFTTDGRRVTRIGAMPADSAIAAVMPVAHGDNEWQKKEIVAAYLAVPEVLHSRGVIASTSEVPIAFGDGTTAVFEPVAPEGARQPSPPWSFRYLEEEKAVYFDYDEVANGKDETLAAFSERMFRLIDEHPVEKLIIDLRDNYGGDGALNRALVHGLIRAKKLQAPGTLFVLIGRRTFSAAMMFAIDLEQNTNAIFIGEPTGGAPNGYGDSKRILLPQSGLTVRVSSLYWQKSDPRDKRDAIAPHSFSEEPLEDALDYFGAPADLSGSWEGVISIEYQRVPFTMIDGKMTSRELDLSPFEFTLRAGTKRLAGTMSANGLAFLVTGAPARRPG